MQLLTRLAALKPPRLTSRAAIYGAALIWLWVTTAMPTDLPLWLSVAWVAAPGVVGLIVSRNMRRAWWRTPVIWFLFLNSYGATAPLILGIGYAWAISQAWILAHPIDGKDTESEQEAGLEDQGERAATNRLRRRLARSGNPAKAAAATEDRR